MLSTAVISPSRPESSSSVSVSTSEVSREITRPEVNRSWKDTDSAWTWSNAAPAQVEQDGLADPAGSAARTPTAAQPDSTAAHHADRRDDGERGVVARR